MLDKKANKLQVNQAEIILYQLHCLCTFGKNNGLANDLAVYKTSYKVVLILILLFACVGCFAILQVNLFLFIILNNKIKGLKVFLLMN